ncbi:MAG: GAF domain-containing sensor histidine kinase, partial [Bacteroidetes bacterium]|nr:GAF domain-containing sensor histidine kinase [Bacteroidota bacterium]
MQVLIFIIVLIVALGAEYFILASVLGKPLDELNKKTTEAVAKDEVYFIETAHPKTKIIAENFNTLIRKLNLLHKKAGEVSGIVEDKKNLEKTLSDAKSSLGSMEAITLMGNKITSSLSYEDIYKNLSEEISSMMDAAKIELAYWDKKKNALVSSNTITPIAEWSFDKQKEVALEDAEKDFMRYVPKEIITADGKKLQSVLCFPLLLNNAGTGVLMIASLRKNAYSQTQINTIKALLTFIAVALDNATLVGELKSTQEQLIHSEKMAYLGQMTAGIAHEIKNPLNFINNFSDISVEISKDIIAKIADADKQEEVKEDLHDLIQNLTKINHYGNRADTIVSDMLKHSSSEVLSKKKLNVVEFANDYIKVFSQFVGYDNPNYSFSFIKDFKDGEMLILGSEKELKVILKNLLSNAFYAIKEKSKSNLENGYIPEITLGISKENNMVKMVVTDNGTGISMKDIDKVFHPFFTTKPTGEGVGLGLSLVYNIVVEGLKGKVAATSVENEFAEFTV